ncbi:hypothetical protein KJ966_06840 [bacterium]|nr:hypothetical protein [bacterium]
MTTNLEESTDKYFKSFNLTTSQMSELKALEESYTMTKPFFNNKIRWVWSLSAIVAGLFIVFVTLQEKEEISPDVIANEIAYNHNKTLSVEFKGNSINEIKPHFSKLDFNLVPSDRNRISNFHIVGGRYISINKRLAAQLQLKKQDNKDIATWYQLPLPVNHRLLAVDPFKKDLEVYSNGVKVIIWEEKGVLHGLARKQ